MRDGHNDIEFRRVISAVRQTNADTAIVGEIIDGAGVDSLEYVISYGALTDANATIAVLLEESSASDMSGAVAVADADLYGTEAAAGAAAASDDNKVAKLGYRGSKRYTRLTITPTGNDSGNVDVCALAVLRGHYKQPV